MSKKLTITIVLILSQVILFAQTKDSCLPEGILFTNQEEIDNFPTNYPGCTVIEGNVTINGEDIVNTNGLLQVTSIGGALAIGVFDVFGDPSNPNLLSISGFENLTSIGGSLEMCQNNALTSLSGFENLTSIGGHLWIRYSGLMSISSLGNVASIGYGIRINNNGGLNSLAGLENLTSIVGTLYVVDNYSLSSLTGFENVTNIEMLLVIRDNANLINLAGLNNLISVGNSLDISGNDALSSLTGLESLSSINGELEIGGGYPSDGNHSLIDISALGNLAESSITNLKIRYNSSLSTCAVQSICDYLASPNGFYMFNDNAPGCNSPEEVEEACLETSVQEIPTYVEIVISPNPVKDQVMVSLNIQSKSSVEICIYNITGICLKNWQFQNQQPGEKEFNLDLKDLPAGVYFSRVQIGDEIVTKKIIKIQ